MSSLPKHPYLVFPVTSQICHHHCCVLWPLCLNTVLLTGEAGSLKLSSWSCCVKCNSHTSLNWSEVFGVQGGWGGHAEGKGEGLAATRLQGDAGASQQCLPGYSKLAFHSRGWKWQLLARLWFTFWLKQTEVPFSAWKARTCFCPGREGGPFFWVCQDALAVHGVLQLLSRTSRHVLSWCSFDSFPMLFPQPNWGIP